MRYVPALLVVLAIPMSVIAQADANLSAFAPELMIVAEFDAAKGQLQLRQTQIREQDVQSLTVGGNGGVTLETRKVFGPIQTNRYLELKECKVMEASGKAIAPADFARRFKVGAAVVLTNDGQPPAKAFLQLLQPDTIIIVGPAVKTDPAIKLPEEPKKMPKQ